MVVADFNADGHLDTAFANNSPMGGMTAVFGNGDGTFQDFYSLPLPSISSFDTQAADLDHDGIVDLILSSESEIDLLINNGDGTFQLPIRLDAPGLVRRSIPHRHAGTPHLGGGRFLPAGSP